jgi:hypothetical protein
MGVAMDSIRGLANRKSLFRPKDVEALGLSRNWMGMMTFLCVVQRVAPGIYGLPRMVYDPAAIAAARLPRGIACLTTALELHGWSDVPALPVWWALPRTARKPLRRPIPMRFIQPGPATFGRDVEQLSLQGVALKVYSLERTISDCMRWRSSLNPDPTSTWWLRVLDEARRLGIGEKANRWRLTRPADRIAA